MEINEKIKIIQIPQKNGYMGHCPFRYEHCTTVCEHEEGMEHSYAYLCGYPGKDFAGDCGFPDCPLKEEAVLVRFVPKENENDKYN